MTRKPRADALRNRAAILASARALITTTGPDIGMDEIAAHAGVAVGTLYRHYPTKTDLVAAVMDATATAIVAALDAALTRIDAGEATALAELTGLFRRLAGDLAHDRALRAVAAGLGAYRPDALERPARSALTRMVEAAHAAGDLRPDVTVDDLALLMSTMPDADVPEAARARWVDLVWRGLAANPGESVV